MEPKAWELSVNKDGIAVYTSTMPNTKIKRVKAEIETAKINVRNVPIAKYLSKFPNMR